MKRQWEPNRRHGTTRRCWGSSGWGQGGQRWMGEEIRHSNMDPGRMHNHNVHRQSSSGGEGVGQCWVAPDMRYSHPGGGGPYMEHGHTDNWIAPNMR